MRFYIDMKNEKEFLFGKRAYRIMGIGIALIVLGFVLMTGGGSDDPNVFNPEMYSPIAHSFSTHIGTGRIYGIGGGYFSY